ncbi:hypothetical protein PGIGA_G00171010 [Pangasianodon gigas]|uniref:Uncharacterized protein n=1 Tax=Pangasianodon gigas TaxID=30993 RepID=A0ACC5XTU5_PANGG|nr:hypothetical protein [Pangasianodon gigas]
MVLLSLLDMLRARRKKVTISASGAEHSARTRRSRVKRCSEEKDGKDPGMGGAVSSQEADPPNQENPTSLQTTVKVRSTKTLPLPEELDYSKMCPKCSSFLKPAVVPAGHTTSLLQCPRCSTTPLCEHCLYHCPDGTCTNQSCQVVSMLLTCDQVRDSNSRVYGCPLFRACPKCHSIMMHQSGCKYVSCAQCRHIYCFICLRIKQECVKDTNKYWSLNCSAPRAARQRFQT